MLSLKYQGTKVDFDIDGIRDDFDGHVIAEHKLSKDKKDLAWSHVVVDNAQIPGYSWKRGVCVWQHKRERKVQPV